MLGSSNGELDDSDLTGGLGTEESRTGSADTGECFTGSSCKVNGAATNGPAAAGQHWTADTTNMYVHHG